MNNFIGIDLGTTNSVICSYDGSETRVWKSPEQNDVTPSAIYIDRRGNKYVGKRAYDSSPYSPDNSAMLFKRLMGTSTPIQLSAVNLTKTPEECSAEILRVLFGYLPEEVRSNADTGTVITVPAAFNQMQKDATMQAANTAGIGKVALMQEPVAAVMSVMRTRDTNGMFLIYDLGGGTLDIAIAQSIGGHVDLLAHGGIAMCGGRDFDRALVDNVVRPWLLDNFDLPEDFAVNPDFKSITRLATWATERAKIELSAREEVTISLSEVETRSRDTNGNEIYLDIPLQRDIYDELIAERIGESIEFARETINKAGLSPDDLEHIVFIGGPTNYDPLRKKVSFELGIVGNTDVNPMTAVAEGASLFAESIDWATDDNSRKDTHGKISSSEKLALSFSYAARTPDATAKVAVQLKEPITGMEFQIDSIDTGWTSGRRPLENGTIIDLNLSKSGDNTYKAFVFDSSGQPVTLEQDRIIITRTAATVDAIPASHSVGIEVKGAGGSPELEYLVHAGDLLPKEGKKEFRADESLKAGAPESINLKIWEGEIENPVTDNRSIGVMKISGSDFDDGVISANAVLECDYKMLDSGNIILEVSVPSIGGVFHSNQNFYSRQEGQLDYAADVIMIIEKGESTLKRINEISENDKVADDPRLEQARRKAETAVALDPEEVEIEKSQEAMENIHEARRILAQVRKENLKEIRQIELERVISLFDQYAREHARPSEASSFDNLAKTAQRSLDKNDRDFEHHLDEMRGNTHEILRRQDWVIIELFKSIVDSPHLFADRRRFEELASTGAELIRSDDIDQLRTIVEQLMRIRIKSESDDEILDRANITRG